LVFTSGSVVRKKGVPGSGREGWFPHLSQHGESGGAGGAVDAQCVRRHQRAVQPADDGRLHLLRKRARALQQLLLGHLPCPQLHPDGGGWGGGGSRSACFVHTQGASEEGCNIVMNRPLVFNEHFLSAHGIVSLAGVSYADGNITQRLDTNEGEGGAVALSH
jgi:hypothetical protein